MFSQISVNMIQKYLQILKYVQIFSRLLNIYRYVTLQISVHFSNMYTYFQIFGRCKSSQMMTLILNQSLPVQSAFIRGVFRDRGIP